MSDIPLYQRIYNDYAAAIKSGRLTPGQKLPSEQAIASNYHVSRITSKRAMELLRDDGYIERTPGRGSFVLSARRIINRQEAAVTAIEKLDPFKPFIGLIMPDFSESYGMEILTGVERHVRDRGYSLLFRRSLGSQDMETEAIEDFYQAGCEGLILMPQHNDFLNDRIVRLLLDGNPIVIIDREMEGIEGTFISSDNYEAAYKATLRLLNLGHKDIAFLGYPTQSASTLEDRFRGFQRAFYQKKFFWNDELVVNRFIENAHVTDIHERARLDINIIKSFIMEHPQVTAIFATEYNFGQMAMMAIEELGYRIPEDISLLGYDGPSSLTGNPFLTRILQPQEAMGEEAVKALIMLLNDETPERVIKLPSTLSNGRSIGPVRTHALGIKAADNTSLPKALNSLQDEADPAAVLPAGSAVEIDHLPPLIASSENEVH